MKSRISTSGRVKEIAQPRAEKWGTRRNHNLDSRLLSVSPSPRLEILWKPPMKRGFISHSFTVHAEYVVEKKKDTRYSGEFRYRTGGNLESARLSSACCNSRLHPDIWYSQKHTLVLYRARGHGRALGLTYKRVFLCNGEALVVCFIDALSRETRAKRACRVAESLHRYVVSIDNVNTTWSR